MRRAGWRLRLLAAVYELLGRLRAAALSAMLRELLRARRP